MQTPCPGSHLLDYLLPHQVCLQEEIELQEWASRSYQSNSSVNSDVVSDHNPASQMIEIQKETLLFILAQTV